MESCRPYYDRLVSLHDQVITRDPEDWMFWGTVERNLQLALECAIDAGEMVISWKRWGFVEENKDVMRVLGKHGVLPQPLAERMASAAGLRNALVHRYGTIDVESVRRAVLHDLKDLDAFAKAVARFVQAA